MDRVIQVEMLADGRCIRGVVVHIMAVADLSRAAMAAPVVGNHAVVLAEEIKQLCVPIICAQWLTVMKDERLRIFRAPIFVEDLHTAGCGERDGAQLSSGCEVAHTGTHSGAACWSMESPKREEPSGPLLAFDRRAHPHALQEVSDASAPPQTGFKRAHLGRLVCDVTPVLLSTSAR